jgi:SAM-dependent methyltransferase
MINETQNSYDKVAANYAERFVNELARKAFDRKMLDWLIERVGVGLICDMGCGPGHVAAYMQSRGANVLGIDLSAQMVAEATRLFPTIQFYQGDMMNLAGVANEQFSGIAAFYSIIHIEPENVLTALRELGRTLKNDGLLLLTYHIGDEVRHFDEWLEKPVNLDFRFYQTAAMKNYLHDAGFVLEEVIEREAYPEIEAQTRRAYLFARKL